MLPTIIKSVKGIFSKDKKEEKEKEEEKVNRGEDGENKDLKTSAPLNKSQGLRRSLVMPSEDSQKITEQLEQVGHVYVVASDIGGTNARFVIAKVDYKTEAVEIVLSKKYPSANYKGLEEPMRVFLGQDNPEKLKPAFCVIAIAGPVADGVATITNVDWRKISEKEILEEFNMTKVCFINDFAAMGYGCLNTPEERMCNLTDIPISKNASKTVLGPGSGLGEALLFKSPNQNQYDVHASEGGWSTFACRDETDFELMNFVKKSKNSRSVCVEWMVNGPSIKLIYEFYRQKNPNLKSCIHGEGLEITAEDEPKIIVEAAKAKSNELAVMTIKKWAEMLFVEAGNLGTKTLSYGGVFIVGGVINAVLPFVQEHKKELVDAFFDKNAMERFMREKMPLIIITNDNLGLDGSLEYGKRIAIGAQADNEVMNLYEKKADGKKKTGSQIWLR